MLSNREFHVNVRVVTSVLILLHKSIALEMTLNLEVTVPEPVTGMIQIAWYIIMQPSKYKCSSATQVEAQ